LQMAFDFSDPGSASLRTSKDISAWGCPTSSKTWQEWVTERRGAYSARLKSAHRTSESECSSWPTVRHEENWQGHGSTQSYAENGANKQVNYRYNKQGEKVFLRKGTFDITLTTAVMAQNWPSPVASEVRQGFQDRSRGMKGSQESLTTVVIKQHGPAVPASSNTNGSRPGLWVTPRNADSRNPGPTNCKPGSMMHLGTQAAKQAKSWATPDASDRRSDKSRQVSLSNQMKSETWPTPASSGVTGGPTGLAGGAGNREKLASMLPEAEAKAMGCGKLNPRWVETLMGLPVGWTMPSCASPVTIAQTNSGYSATVLSQQQHTERFAHSSKS
jgi:hypothetical protein